MECLRKPLFGRRWLLIAGLFAIIMMVSPAAFADQTAPALTPGNQIPAFPTADDPGTLLDSMASTTTCNACQPGFSGYEDITVTSAVYLDGMTGTLNFLYQVYNHPDSSDAAGVQLFSVNNFAGYATGVGFNDAGSTIPGGVFMDETTSASGCGTGGSAGMLPCNPEPELVGRSADGITLSWNYGVSGSDFIVPGLYSSVMYVETNATTYSIGGAHTNDGVALNYSAFQPAPEPASLALIGGGLLLLAGFRKAVKKH